MKQFFCVLLATFTLLVSQAQTTVSDANAEIRKVGSFSAVSISNAFDVIITQGAEEAVAVSASDKDDVQYIKTEVKDGVLRISFDPKDKKFWPKNRKLRAYISAKNLNAISAGGASNIKIEGGLSAAQLKLNFSGASDLKGKLNVTGALDVRLSGASDIEISGSATELSVDASGASDLKAFDFVVSNCKKIEASGASSVRISVNNEISEARLSGASSLTYKGNPSIKDIRTSGASSVSRKS